MKILEEVKEEFIEEEAEQKSEKEEVIEVESDL
jgi:hypothetical protein